jgi:hypothetical protein
MKRNGLETLVMVAVLVGWGLASQAEAQTGRYVRGSSGIVTRSVPGHYAGHTYGVSHARRHLSPTTVESDIVMKGDSCGCGRCLPAIIPTLLNGISSALDCLLPCRSCGVKQGCNDCGRTAVLPSRTYRPKCCSPLGILPMFSIRLNHGGHCGCYSHEMSGGIPVENSVPTEAAPEEAIPKPVPDEAAARSARRFQTREEALRSYRPSNGTLRLAPPRAAAPRTLQRYGRVVEQKTRSAQEVIRTGYTPTTGGQGRVRTASGSGNPLRR